MCWMEDSQSAITMEAEREATEELGAAPAGCPLRTGALGTTTALHVSSAARLHGILSDECCSQRIMKNASVVELMS